MKKSVIENSILREKIYTCEFDNGLKAYVFPKEGYTKKYATYATRYGSINSEFIIPGKKDITKVPDGIAHFLEHKLFEQEDGPVMDKFSALGASSNAYTSFDHTAYLFSGSESFEESFKLLMRFVQNPSISEESVENEKGIIGQEIRMYDDNPNWRVFFNFLDALYHKHPVKIDIAGTVESISGITRDILYKCFNTFYHPSNMMVLVVGDVNPDWVFDTVWNNQKITEAKTKIKRIFPDEPSAINKKVVEQKMEIATPLFIAGFKDDITNMEITSAVNIVGMGILTEMVFGRSSELYKKLYENGLINANFDADYTFAGDYAYSTVGGESRSPEEALEIIRRGIQILKNDGLNEKEFERIKNMKLGSFIKEFNSVERIGHSFVANYMRGVNFFELAEAHNSIDFGTVKRIFERHFDLEKLAISMIKPIKDN